MFCFELQDLLVNSNGGYLDNRLKYMHSTINGRTEHANEVDIDTVADAVDNIDIVDLDETDSETDNSQTDQGRSVAQKEMEYLKTVVANEQNLEILKSKLVATYDLRCEVLNKSEINLRLEFPYFFTCPELVGFNFEL